MHGVLPTAIREHTVTPAQEACLSMILLPEWRERIEDFIKTIDQRTDMSATDHLVVVLNTRDGNGGVLAKILMPQYVHEAYARGITRRSFVQRALDGGARNPDATVWARAFAGVLAAQLRAIDDIAVIVMDFGTIAILDARLVLS